MTQVLEKSVQLGDTINELHNIFNALNQHFFENKLETPIIVVQSSKKRTLGTFSVNRIWQRKTKEAHAKKFEITLSAEHLNRTTEEISATLLHEMVHLYNSVNNIKDTSNNCVYHNKNFKKEAEKHGLIIEKAPTIGWSLTTLPNSTKTLLKTFNINEAVFDYYRTSPKTIAKIKLGDLTPKEKLQRLYDRRATLENKLDALQNKIEQLESETNE